MSEDGIKEATKATEEPVGSGAPDATAAAASSPLPEEEVTRLTDAIVSALKTVYDPEIPVDIYELGLIYKIDIADDRAVKVDMTLTTPELPVRAGTSHDGRERGRKRARCRSGRRRGGVGSAVGPEPDVGRGPRRAEHVVRCARDWSKSRLGNLHRRDWLLS